jgi:hypothetical protein
MLRINATSKCFPFLQANENRSDHAIINLRTQITWIRMEFAHKKYCWGFQCWNYEEVLNVPVHPKIFTTQSLQKPNIWLKDKKVNNNNEYKLQNQYRLLFLLECILMTKTKSFLKIMQLLIIVSLTDYTLGFLVDEINFWIRAEKLSYS